MKFQSLVFSFDHLGQHSDLLKYLVKCSLSNDHHFFNSLYPLTIAWNMLNMTLIHVYNFFFEMASHYLIMLPRLFSNS